MRFAFRGVVKIIVAIFVCTFLSSTSSAAPLRKRVAKPVALQNGARRAVHVKITRGAKTSLLSVRIGGSKEKPTFQIKPGGTNKPVRRSRDMSFTKRFSKADFLGESAAIKVTDEGQAFMLNFTDKSLSFKISPKFNLSPNLQTTFLRVHETQLGVTIPSEAAIEKLHQEGYTSALNENFEVRGKFGAIVTSRLLLDTSYRYSLGNSAYLEIEYGDHYE